MRGKHEEMKQFVLSKYWCSPGVFGGKAKQDYHLQNIVCHKFAYS